MVADNGGVIRRLDHHALVGAIDRLQRNGELVSVLPGVLVPRELSTHLPVLAAAAHVWQPDVVVSGAAAARLTFHPEHPMKHIDLLGPTRHRVLQPYRFTRTRVPPEWVIRRGGVVLSAPAWTAAWMAAWDNGAAIDDALRARVRLRDIERALTTLRARPGQRQRSRIVAESRDLPWSQAERELHRILREEGITGWTGNFGVCIEGRRFVIDVAVPEVMLAMEFNSVEFHLTRERFLSDQEKICLLGMAGWTYFPITWPLLQDRASLVKRLHTFMAVASSRSALNAGILTSGGAHTRGRA